MKIIRNTAPISDLYNQMKSRELTTNRDYQRGQGLWPNNARSYFIDSILNEFPFPKVVIRQTVDLVSRKSKREIVDGQQRLGAIKDFIEDKFRLTTVSSNYRGKTFTSLDDEEQARFLSYEVSADVIVSATDDEILEIFRRINSYQLPLNDAEKRHAAYQGEFKWFIKEMLDKYSPMLERYKIFSIREISRMEDAVLLTELTQIVISGIRRRDSRLLNKLYSDYDNCFEQCNTVRNILVETLDFIKVELNDILASETIKPYMLYSLVSALVYNKYGIEGANLDDLGNQAPVDKFCDDASMASRRVLELINLADTEHLSAGEARDFKNAAASSTTNIKNRITRLRVLSKVLRGQETLL
jgi:hypothetical protein